jgi:hypothetical protein
MTTTSLLSSPCHDGGEGDNQQDRISKANPRNANLLSEPGAAVKGGRYAGFASRLCFGVQLTGSPTERLPPSTI